MWMQLSLFGGASRQSVLLQEPDLSNLNDKEKSDFFGFDCSFVFFYPLPFFVFRNFIQRKRKKKTQLASLGRVTFLWSNVVISFLFPFDFKTLKSML